MNRASAELHLHVPSLAPAPDTGARLGSALLLYMASVTLIVTLTPFRFEWPEEWRVTHSVVFSDLVANVLLFIPLGFLYCLAAPRTRPRSVPMVVLVGAVASAAIEVTQLFEPTRRPSFSDVAANAAGAWLGTILFSRLSRAKRGGVLLGWLALELPLMGLVYLLVPLLWVSSLASGDDPVRSAITLVLGVFGALVLGGLQRHYFGPAGTADALETAVFAAIWLVAGAFPLLVWHPPEFCAAVALVGTLCWWRGRSRRVQSENRRFEVPLLKIAAPVYALYVALTIVAPLRGGVSSWTAYLGFAPNAGHQVEILRLLELVAAFTLVGYILVEFSGRRLLAFRDALPRLLAWGIGLAIAAQLVQGHEAGPGGASLAAAALLAGATLYGGWLYHLQRAHVLRLVAAGRAGVHSG